MVTIDVLKSFIETNRNEDLKTQIESTPDIVTLKTEQGISLLQYAAYCRNDKAIEILRIYTPKFNIYEASSLGEIEAIKSLILQKTSIVNEFSPDGFTALGLACFFGHVEVVKLLLLEKANPNLSSANSFKVTPLHSACAISNFEIANLLIRNGADVNARQQQGVTPLHSAAYNGKIELVKLLIQNGADTSAEMENGKTTADIAIEKEHKEIAEYIIQYLKK